MTQNDKIRVKMLRHVFGCGFVCPPGTVAKGGMEYEGSSNQNGAISAILPNGEKLGLKPGEFEFLEAPEWVLRIWAQHDPNITCRLVKRKDTQ
jgi:hypothetical protein